MNEFENFISQKPRMLPVICLLDNSGSMGRDGKIQTLNTAVRDMLETFKKEKELHVEINAAVISFSSEVKMHIPLSPASDINYRDLYADGITRMGDALDMAGRLIEDKNTVPKNAYRPVVILVSDGLPYSPDDPGNRRFEQQLQSFISEGRSAKCDRWSLAIGSDADTDLLKRFINNDKKDVCFAKDAADILKFFKFISTSTIQRSKSQNPNLVSEDLFKEDIMQTDFDSL